MYTITLHQLFKVPWQIYAPPTVMFRNSTQCHTEYVFCMTITKQY